MKYSLQNTGLKHCIGVVFVHTVGLDFCHGNGTEIYTTGAILLVTDCWENRILSVTFTIQPMEKWVSERESKRPCVSYQIKKLLIHFFLNLLRNYFVLSLGHTSEM